MCVKEHEGKYEAPLLPGDCCLVVWAILVQPCMSGIHDDGVDETSCWCLPWTRQRSMHFSDISLWSFCNRKISNTIIIHTSQMRKGRHWEVKSLLQGHRTSSGRAEVCTPSITVLISRACMLSCYPVSEKVKMAHKQRYSWKGGA